MSRKPPAPMKAFLLAAGLGTRLGALTEKTPKCLLPVAGEPVLHWWLTCLAALGVRDVLLNTHHLGEQVETFIRERRYGVSVRLFPEPRLLGSGGTVAANADFVAGEKSFWIFYADTLIGAPLKPLARLHEESGSDLTLGLFHSPEPESCGIAELSAEGKILSFEEKPRRPRGDLAAAGAYVAGPALLRALSDLTGAPRPLDLSGGVFPSLMKNAYGRVLDGPVLDIGTPNRYKRAQRDWALHLRRQ